MNDRLAAMLALAALRDSFVVRLFVTAAIVLLSAWMLDHAPLPTRIGRLFIGVQMGAYLLGWIMLLVVLGTAGG